MVTGGQSVIRRALNPNAKYTYKVKKRQYITGTDDYMSVKYSYSKLISTLPVRKYSYAV